MQRGVQCGGGAASGAASFIEAVASPIEAVASPLLHPPYRPHFEAIQVHIELLEGTPNDTFAHTL